jgi:prolyl oligopeptidase
MLLSRSSLKGVEESIHGVVACDPYRWLEDRSLPETQAWIENQQLLYDEYFSESRDLDSIRDRVREYLDVEVVDQPAKSGNRYLYRRRDRGSEQACIYVRDIDRGREQLLVASGPFASAAIHRVAADGSLLAYELRQGGADTAAIRLVDVGSGAELPDTLGPSYPRGLAFANDRTGFYYCHEPVGSSEDHVIRFHRLGERARDRIVYRVPRVANSRLILTSDNVHLGAFYIHWRDGEPVTDISLARRDTPAEWHRLLSDLGADYRPFLNDGRIFALSFKGPPNGSLLELNNEGLPIRVIVPEQTNAIQQLVLIHGKVICTYLDGWGTATATCSLSKPEIKRLDVPFDGTIQLRHLPGSDALFCDYESFDEPPTICEFIESYERIDIWHKQAKPLHRTAHIAPTVVPSKDGTPVPLILVTHKASMAKSKMPTLMTAYGGFGVPVTPQYSALISIMLELGCTFVLARIRGGGEFGNAWHDAGKRRRRQNTFDDFIAAASWLSTEGLTSPDNLAIFGASNSGLLVAAVLTQRPDLFGAVLSIAPLLDMVRYEKFDQAARWRDEYGSAEDAEDFHALYAHSPYHHVDDGIDYPPVLFISGDRDDRCNPAHVKKMAARMMQRDAQTHPILVDYSNDRGHYPPCRFQYQSNHLPAGLRSYAEHCVLRPNGSSRCRF